MGKSYIELWNVVAVPISNLSPYASMYRIKPERIFFYQNEFLYNVQHKNRKYHMEEKLRKFGINMGQRIQYFAKKKNIRVI